MAQKDLFYSKHEKILFLITGYDGSHLVKDLMIAFRINYERMRELSKGASEIYTDEILHSSRYKSMRYYWCKTDVIPEEAFVIGDTDKPDDPNRWTMSRWIHN